MRLFIKQKRAFCLAFMCLAFMVPKSATAQDCLDPDGYIGTIVFNSSFDAFQGCTLNGWVAFHTPPPALPAFAFTFPDVADVPVSTLTTSDIVLISGLGANVPVTLSGGGAPEFRNCSDATCTTEINTWSTGTLSLSDGEYLQLRLTSDEYSGQTLRAYITDGTSQEAWDVRTEIVGDCSAPNPAYGTVCADGTVYAGDTPDGYVHMYVTRCDAGQTWIGGRCAGTRLTFPWNDGNADYTSTGYRSTVTGQANSAGVAASDANSAIAGIQSHYAAIYCENLSQDGHSDWYLPAKQELAIMYNNSDAIGNFSTTALLYSSSTERDLDRAEYQRFTDGWTVATGKGYRNARLRCARHD